MFRFLKNAIVRGLVVLIPLVLVYLTLRELFEAMLVVMQPWTPTPFAGSVRVVPRNQVDLVPVTLDEYSLALTHFGLGLSEALQKRGPRQ